MSTFTNTAREVEMPNGDVVVIHNAPTGGENTTSNIKKFKYDDNGHVTESTAADAEDLNLSGYSTPTTGTTAIGTSDDVQTAIGKLDHQSHIDQTNILSVQSSLVGIIRNAGGKNLVKLDDLDYIKSINTQGTWHDNVYTRNSVTFTINDDGTITVNGTNDSSTISAVLNCAIIPYSEFTLTGDVISGSVVNGKTEFTIRQGAPLYTVLGRSYSGSSAVISQPTEGADEVLISVIVYANQTIDNEVVKPMICTQDLWNQSHEFQPFALNNQDLTKTVENLSYANNIVIPELVNNGSKNLWDFANANVVQVQGTPTYIKTDTDITVSTSSATTQWARVCYKITLPAGNYVWRTKITNFSATSEIRMGVADSLNNQDMTWYRRTQITGNGVFTVEIPNASSGDVYIEFYINFSDTIAPSNTATFSENMICTEADWKVSQKYVPYARPNYDLTRLQAEDRAALAEQIDEGAKNVFKTFEASEITTVPATIAGLTFIRNADNSITLNGTNSTGSDVFIKIGVFNYEAGKEYVMGYSCIKDNNVNKAYAYSSDDYLASSYDPVRTHTYSSNGSAYVYIRVASDYQFVNDTIYPMICTKAKYDISPAYEPFVLPNTDLTRMMTPFFTVPINHNMIYRGQNLGDTLTADQDTALSSGNFTDLYLGDYWTKTVSIPAFYELTTAEPADWSTNYTSYYTKSGDTYTAVTGDTAPTWAANTYYERLVPSQTVTLKAVIADFDTFYGGYNSSYAIINTHHAAVIVTGFSNVVWNKTNSTAGGYVASLIHKWLVGSALPQLETWFGSAKVLSHQKLLTNAITGDAASGWAWSSQKIALLSENQMYGSKVWGNSKASNGGYEPGEAHKHLNVFNHIAPNMLFGNKNIWCRDIASAVGVAYLSRYGDAGSADASYTGVAPAALILLS